MRHMGVLLISAALLGTVPTAAAQAQSVSGVRQRAVPFQTFDKQAVPRELIQSSADCLADNPDNCWSDFLGMGEAWSGDVNGDGENELLIFTASSESSGTGGVILFLYRQWEGKWRLLANLWSATVRLQILPSTHNGFHDLRNGPASCLKWTGAEYVEYAAGDYGKLSPAWFDSEDLDDAEIFWAIRYRGRQEFTLEPQWFPAKPWMNPRGGTTALADLDDPVLHLRWRAMFKGGVYGVRDGKAFLLLPPPAYRGAEKLEFDGDWLVILADVPDAVASGQMQPATPARPERGLRRVARFNRRSNLLSWLIPSP